jgi:hypothetical protein
MDKDKLLGRKQANQLPVGNNSNNDRSTGSTTSKEIARKVVEEEFRKKKKRKHGGGDGGGYASSSEEDNHDNDNIQNHHDRKTKRGKQKMDQEQKQEKERTKAMEEDLATRYRDRAKERRERCEGEPVFKVASVQESMSTTTTTTNQQQQPLDQMIVPHNHKKGLDLNLIRKEQQRLKTQKKLAPNFTTTMDDAVAATTTVRKEMPSSIEEAMEILRKFFLQETSFSIELSTSIPFSHGIIEYIREFVKWTTEPKEDDDNNNNNNNYFYNSVSYGTVGKTLQNTQLAFAIDGNPSDPAKAWQRPRQFTTTSSSSSSSTTTITIIPMLPTLVMDQIGRLFHKRQRMLNEMKQQQQQQQQQQPMTNLSSPKTMISEKNVTYYDKDDDIFGGLDEYVPPTLETKPKN